MTTDFAAGTGDPEPHLAAIADAGFDAVHWCHEWDTDHVYEPAEVDGLRRRLEDLGLTVTDVHASKGQARDWTSLDERERAAGVGLVRNRMEMARELGADVIIMHLPDLSDPASAEASRGQWFRSLEELEPFSRETGVRIALENGKPWSIPAIEQAFGAWAPDYLGLCWDCGHGNLYPGALDELERNASRLISIHLHDNDGTGDQHRRPFTGTVDWERLMAVIARSSYSKWVNLETSMRNTDIPEVADFLRANFEAAGRLARMLETRRERA